VIFNHELQTLIHNYVQIKIKKILFYLILFTIVDMHIRYLNAKIKCTLRYFLRLDYYQKQYSTENFSAWCHNLEKLFYNSANFIILNALIINM
jgi:hypothetical protein